MAKPILVEIFADSSQFSRELNKASGETRRFGAVAKVVGGALITGIAFGLEQSVKAAIDAQDSQRRLAQAFKNSGLAVDDYSKQIQAAQDAGRQLGFSDTEVRDSLGSLLTATHSVAASMKDLQVAQDLARFTGKDLVDTTKFMTSAMSGSQRAIKALGLAVSPVTAAVDALKNSNVDLSTAAGRAELAHAKLLDKMATGNAVINAAAQATRGQAQAFSESAAGGMAQFSAQLDHLKVQIGDVLLPLLTRLLTQANELVTSFNSSLGPAINTVSAAFTRVHGSAALFNSLFLPIREMLLVWRAEMVALEGAVRAGTAAFNALRAAGATVAAFFTGVMHGAITTVHGAMSGLDSAINAVHSGFNSVLSAARSVAAFVGGGLSAALHSFRSVASGVSSVIDAISGALNAAANAARALAGALSSIHVPRISLPHIGLPHIPGTATGGIVTGPQVRLVGEAGPEAIIPLDSSKDGVLGGDTYNINMPNYLGNVREAAAEIRRELLRVQARNSNSIGFN